VIVAGRIRGLLERLLARRREAAGEGVSDAELLRRFTQERDEAAFELLVWRHGGMVLGLCRRAVRDEQLAEDAFQAVFLVLARKAGGIRGNLGGWLFKVARRVSARALQRQPAGQPVGETPAPATADPAERDELTAILDAEIARLPERLRKPVVLCYLGGHSTEDAARELNCPRGTVLSRLAAARKRLAARLTRRGVTLPATLVVGLSAKLVSSASAAAPSFRTGTLALTTASELANGVLRTMNRLTLVGLVGGVTLAATLGSGLVWVAGSGNSGGPGMAVAAEPALPPAPPVKAAPPAPPAPDEAAALERQRLEERTKKLEVLAEKMRAEIETTEKNLRLLKAANGEDAAARQAELRARLAEIETEVRQATRELDKLESEVAVLKKLLDDKNPPPLDPAVIQEAVARDPLVVEATTTLAKAQRELEVALQISVGETPKIADLKKFVATAEKRLEVARKRAAEEAAATLRASEGAKLRERLAKLDIEIKIKKEILAKLQAERNTVKKLLGDAATARMDDDLVRASLDEQRALLRAINQELQRLRLQRQGITLPEATTSDAKLDLILKELAALRKEVQELKAQKK
jgi:RNA polymerase sigma factor (sigma-70 family)